MSANFFLDNEDLRFQFENVINWQEIVDLTEAGYTLPDGHANLQDAMEFYRSVMEAVGEYSGEQIAPRWRQIDQEGNHLVDGEVVYGKAIGEIFEGIKQRELYGMNIPRELGGQNCPMALFFVTAELFARADTSVMTHYGFHGGIAMALLAYAAKEGSIKIDKTGIVSTRWEGAIREIAAGNASGAMDLTEPDAGSDLGRIRMKAEERNGKWHLTGEKVYITSGQGQYHLVLAKTGSATGGDEFEALKRLSLFLVPRKIERDGKVIHNIKVTKIEEKIGHHGSATCALEFEDAEGELVGKVNQGFELMLLLMNSARVGVGYEAIGLSEAAFRMARDYASTRKTMGQTINKHPVVAEMLMDMELDIIAGRALNFATANEVEISSKLELLLSAGAITDPDLKRKYERRLSKARRRSRFLTPLVKYAASENAVRIARNGMQIHGGIGYISELGADKFLRDSLVLTIYEGTSQIQALMALKDNMMMALRKPGLFARNIARSRLFATTTSDELQRLYYKAEAGLYQAVATVLGRVASGKFKRTIADKGWSEVSDFIKMSSWDPKTDFAPALLHAERFAQGLSQVASARILLDQAARFPQRRKIAERYVRRMAPRVAYLTDQILAGDSAVFEWIAELA
ncbi:MAG: acyl-CoA dehydrogenase family protein [Deltaproteobacteria bacterium]|nr:acyl-CoA dehydrogenase family protein [Deltaproteobacteria bacterium]